VDVGVGVGWRYDLDVYCSRLRSDLGQRLSTSTTGGKAQNPDFTPIPEAWLTKNSIYLKE